jgi:hypothetical protein
MNVRLLLNLCFIFNFSLGCKGHWFKQVVFDKSTLPIKQLWATTSIDCASQCLMQQDCNGYIFDSKSKLCYLVNSEIPGTLNVVGKEQPKQYISLGKY